MMELIPNIPRIYTALAEWLACLILILALVPEQRRQRFYFLAPIMGIGQLFLQIHVGTWPLFLWIPGMALNLLWMLVTFHVLVENSFLKNFYLTCKAFIVAEFIAAFSWQLFCYLLYSPVETNPLTSQLFMLFSYAFLALIYYFIERKRQHHLILDHLRHRDLWLVFLTMIIIFTMSNLGFLLSNTSFAIGDSVTIFIFRTFINLCGMLLIYIQEHSRYESNLKNELSAMNNVFLSQYEQYEAYRESNEMVNRKFHDLKHYLEIIELEPDFEKRRHYVEQIREDIQSFQTNIKTGNPIADVVLTRKNIYCIDNQITFTCIVDGASLDFIDTMDLVSLLGNPLDNAIESALKISDREKRLINLRVTPKADFILYQVENYTEANLEFENGLPTTTKADKQSHGYGLKSTAFIAEKYNGSLTVSLRDHWFSLNVLIPIPKKGLL